MCTIVDSGNTVKNGDARLMSVKALSFSGFLLLFLLPTLALAAGRGGFASGAIWLSKEIITEGESVRISASLYNSYDEKLSGAVTFKDGLSPIGSASFSLSPGEGGIVSVSVKPAAGSHSYYAEITDATLDMDDGDMAATEIIGTKTAVIERTVKSAPKPEPAQSASAVSTTEGTQRAISDFSPAVGNVVNPVLDRIDSFRADATAYTEEAMNSARERVAAATSTEPAKDGKVLGVETPQFVENLAESKGVRAAWGYFLLYLNAILNAILRNAALFYPVAVVLLFIALRMLYRRLTGSYY